MMRKPLLTLLLAGAALAVTAQDVKGTVKAGSKALAAYVSDNSNTAQLAEAQSLADEAVAAAGDNYDAHMLRGNAYAAGVNSVADRVTKQNAEYQIAAASDPATAAPDFSGVVVPVEEARNAVEAYQQAYANAEKAKEKKAAIESLQRLSTSLSQLGNIMLSSQRYNESYDPLDMMVEIDAFYKANGEAPLFGKDEDLQQQKYIMAVVANQMGKADEAAALYKELYDASYDDPAVYAGYSQVLIDQGDEEGGLAVLAAGRERYSDNTDILFAEINYYIRKEEYATLETMLQQAIAKEPDNIGLYNALGNVYMNLSQDTEEAEASDAYMEKSIKYFGEAVKRDEANVDATYSIGSLYYNKAVAKAAEMNNLGTSKADQARYDQLNNEINELFDQALPYFERAEKMDPNDRNTLIALKEIYARRNDFEKSKVYKDRLDSMGG